MPTRSNNSCFLWVCYGYRGWSRRIMTRKPATSIQTARRRASRSWWPRCAPSAARTPTCRAWPSTTCWVWAPTASCTRVSALPHCLRVIESAGCGCDEAAWQIFSLDRHSVTLQKLGSCVTAGLAHNVTSTAYGLGCSLQNEHAVARSRLHVLATWIAHVHEHVRAHAEDGHDS
jgi:hypothetical protein